MSHFPKDIYTEPSDVDIHTLRNLGPLAPMAGVWTGQRGLDVKPKAEGPKTQARTHGCRTNTYQGRSRWNL